MTIEFTKENWMATENGMVLMLNTNVVSDEKPIIQFYYYPDENNDLIAIILDHVQVKYMHVNKMITVNSQVALKGYAVVK